MSRTGAIVKSLVTWLLLASLLATPCYAQQGSAVGPLPSATGQAATGQIPATATNDNAAAGKAGEYVSASTADTGTSQTSRTVTITIASPAVVTWSVTTPFVFNCGTPPCNGAAVLNFTTTGALPTGIVAGTNYYVIGSSVSGNTFQIATTSDNAIAGTAINTSGSQSGVQTGAPTALLSSGNAFDLAALSLAAGDWDVSSDVAFLSGAATSITILNAGTNTVSVTSSTIPGRFIQLATAATVPGVANSVVHVGPARYSLSATTTVYCVTSGTFTVGALAAWGGCRARRVR